MGVGIIGVEPQRDLKVIDRLVLQPKIVMRDAEVLEKAGKNEEADDPGQCDPSMTQRSGFHLPHRVTFKEKLTAAGLSRLIISEAE